MHTSRRKPFGRLMPKLKFLNCWARAWENRDRRKGNEIHTLGPLPKVRRVRQGYLADHIAPVSRSEGSETQLLEWATYPDRPGMMFLRLKERGGAT